MYARRTRKAVSAMLCDRLTDDISPANAGKADARTRTGDPFITSEVLYQAPHGPGRHETPARPDDPGALPSPSAASGTRAHGRTMDAPPPEDGPSGLDL